jgi:hypothetical protein
LYFFFLFILLSNQLSGQTKELEIKVSVRANGDKAGYYEKQLLNNINAELLKVPGVRISQNDFNYELLIYISPSPCECLGYDFNYRAHLIKKDEENSDETSIPYPFKEGFVNYDGFEDLSKTVVSDIKLKQLNTVKDR